MIKILLIAAGGGAGTTMRYLLSGLVQRASGSAIPIGTLAVNVIGCFVIGLLATALAGPNLLREEWRLALFVGLLGGFTTFSAFGFETITQFNEGRVLAAGLNVLVHNALGLGAAWLGYRLAQVMA
jgi:fluoride exporter